jgi:YfiH family protein
MPFHQFGTIRYYTFDSLDEAGIIHAIFTRKGGVSPKPWDSLNLGGTVGDDPARVLQNRQLIFQTVGRDPDTLYDVWQVHGTEVAYAYAPRKSHVPHCQADAILSESMDVTLLMRFADCVPILLYDPVRRVVGLVHSGWPGTVKGVARVAVEAMQGTYGSHPDNVLAAIGPSIGPDHYEIGLDVEEQVRYAFGRDAASLLPSANGGVKFNLWAANRLILEESGVRQIELAGICTACHPEDWYSHRGEKGQTGRFGVLMGLNK